MLIKIYKKKKLNNLALNAKLIPFLSIYFHFN